MAHVPGGLLRALCGGIVYVADVGNHAIRRISPDGDVTTLAGRPRIGRRDGFGDVAEFYQPERLVLDAAGNLLVADVGNELIRKVTPAGEVTTVGGDRGKVPRLCSVAVDGAGTIYVGVARWYSDSARFPHSSIYKLESNGDRTLFAGSASDAGGADGAGPEARFDFPFGLAMDGDNNVIVADTGNRAIRRMTSAGVVTTMAGAARAHADGVGETARFYAPGRMTSDASGNLYVLDPPRVRKITPARVVTTSIRRVTFSLRRGTRS